MHFWFGELGLTRLLLQRGLGGIYLVAFLNVVFQFRPLLGERGLLPVPAYLKRVTFARAPSIFHLHYSDRFLAVVGWLGVALSVSAVLGLSDNGPLWLSLAVWSLLYLLYLSIVNVGQAFYAFGWESMLLEAGFFAVFLGPSGMTPSVVPVLALRWMLFRVELGAGLIKLRGDSCWRDLTCLYYHHETQPLPNPLSAYFHHLPKPIQRASVAFSHFVQLAVPFGLWAPLPVASVAGCLLIVHQLALIVSGNYAWLNWLTVVLGCSAFSDNILGLVLPLSIPRLAPRPIVFDFVLYGLGALTLLLSIKPSLNLLSKQQAMNETYNPLHLVGSYGAFGSVTRQRHEVVLEATLDEELSETTHWREYEFKGKPGDLQRRPRQWAPYHLRLDWSMWFLPLRAVVTRRGILSRGYPVWFMRLVRRLSRADAATLALLHRSPFGAQPPSYVRANFYCYQMTTLAERRHTGAHWKRTYLGEYLPALGRAADAEMHLDASQY
ncbi:MAG TPA: lipase maturation factor family protein [Polyangiaceae bacterium]|nr:lipase maturation factor family protein [Polyangiaceae bacterium]